MHINIKNVISLSDGSHFCGGQKTLSVILPQPRPGLGIPIRETIIRLASVQVRTGSLTPAFTSTPFNMVNLSSVHHNISRWAFREFKIFTHWSDKEWHRFTSQLWVELRGRTKETLEEEEATDSGVTLSVASSPDDITTPHTLYCFQSTHFLSVRSRNLHFSKERYMQVEEDRDNRIMKNDHLCNHCSQLHVLT